MSFNIKLIGVQRFSSDIISAHEEGGGGSCMKTVLILTIVCAKINRSE